METEDVSVTSIPGDDRMTASAAPLAAALAAITGCSVFAAGTAIPLAAVVETDLDTDDALHDALLQIGQRRRLQDDVPPKAPQG